MITGSNNTQGNYGSKARIVTLDTVAPGYTKSYPQGASDIHTTVIAHSIGANKLVKSSRSHMQRLTRRDEFLNECLANRSETQSKVKAARIMEMLHQQPPARSRRPSCLGQKVDGCLIKFGRKAGKCNQILQRLSISCDTLNYY